MEIMELELDMAPSSSCWMRRTMTLVGILIIAVLVIICLLVVVVDLSKNSTAKSNMSNNGTVRPHCQTEICIQEAAILISCMNKTIDPCDDFYEFACGRFIQEAHIQDDKSDAYPTSHNKDLVESQVHSIINQPSLPTDIEPYVMLKKMYAACMDTSVIEESGLDQMKMLLTKLGGWPVLQMDNWVEIDWINITQRLRQYGFHAHQFINIDIVANLKNSTEYVVYVDEWKSQDIQETNLRFGLYDRLVKKYAYFLIELAILFGAQREFAIKEVKAVINFRSQLAQAIDTKLKHNRLWTHINITTIDELQKQYTSIPWLDVLNTALAIPNVTLTNQARVAVISPLYIWDFEQIIKKTPKRVQVNHALFEIIQLRINCLPKNIRQAEQQYLASVKGVTGSPERWRTCVEMVTNHFDIAIDALYIRKYGNDSANNDVTKMVSNIKNVFISRLRKVEWMDNETKARAVEKAEMINAHIAYPVELRNESTVMQYYKELMFGSKYILELIIQMSKFKMNKLFSLYSNPVLKNHWNLRLPAITSNAIYDLQDNSIQIPSGFMQKEFYTVGRPMYMNYGGLGSVVAHEITHGFDTNGKWFNKIGDVSDWWNKSANDAYVAKTQCFVEQYNKYVLPGSILRINGKATLAENIADNGGVKDAYLAYLAWIETHERELPLTGLNLTDKQLFWLSFANARCVKYRQAHLVAAVLGASHAPYRFRVLGPLSNTDYFAKDFNCPLGSNMNPIKKCELW